MAILFSALRRKAAFVYPGRFVPRTAVLVPWFGTRARDPVKIFDDGWSEAAAAFAPSAIAATPAQLGLLKLSGIPSLRHAVVALTRLEGPRLGEADRGRLWRAFRVPIFEQIIGERGRLLATECEAHDGLHIEILRAEPAEALFDDPKAPDQRIDHTPCACGRRTPRLIVPGGTEALKSVAAYSR